jgi:hypothetical protein
MPPIVPAACPDAIDAPEADEQRRHLRHLCLDGSVIRLAVRPEYRGRRALLMDASAGGVGFLLQDPLELGTVLAVELGGPHAGAAQGRVARVCHCRPHPTPADAPWLPRRPVVVELLWRVLRLPAPTPVAWHIGCEFTRPLEEEELAGLLTLLGRRHPLGPL